MCKMSAALPSMWGDSVNCNICYHESEVGFISFNF